MGSDRSQIRAYVTNRDCSFQTVLGPISFDANGDTTHPIISEFRFDPVTRDWAFFRQQDLGDQP